MKRYLELSDRLHESNVRTHIEVMGYPMTVQTALEILENVDRPILEPPFYSSNFTKRKNHPLLDFMLKSTQTDIYREDDMELIDPMHLCGNSSEKVDPEEKLKLELEYAIMKSNCETDI